MLYFRGFAVNELEQSQCSTPDDRGIFDSVEPALESNTDGVSLGLQQTLPDQVCGRAKDSVSPYLQNDEIDRELCSPQHVEMRTFRDAIDVNYQRMGLTGEECSGASF